MKLSKLLIFIACLVHTVSCLKEGSLTFVIDNTNSMKPDIKYVTDGVDKIMDVILKKKSSQIEDIILVRFNDPDYEKLITTRDREDLKKVLKNLRTWSNYRFNRECPEMALHGVKLGLKSSKDNSHIFVFADSSPKDFELTQKVIRLAQSKSSQIVFILTEGNDCGESSEMFNPYYEIAEATSGQVLRIKAKTEIKKVIDYIAETCSGGRTVLVQTNIPERENRRIWFDIDDQTEYVIISASGNHVALDWSNMVRNSNNVYVKKITWLDNFKAVKVTVPKPGRYSVTVWGKSETSVVVYGRTNFKFHHGFSLSPVQSLMDTVKNPTAGERHQLAISVNDPDRAVLVDAVELLDMNGNVLMNLSLNRESPDFYTTKPFLPPISTFLIAVVGEGKYTHKPIRRISKTPIEPKIKDLEPIITIDRIKETYEYNSKLHLNCNVKGYPRPHITWTDENSNILRNTTLKKNPPYDYSYHLTVEKLKKSQRYTCHAENEFGKTSKNVFVNVDSPFVVTEHLDDVTYVSFEKEIELICDIKSKWPMNITWWNNGKLVASRVTNDGTTLVVDKAIIEDQDTYICQAKLLEDGLTRRYKTKLQIKGLKPIVTVGQIKDTYEYNSKLYLDCNVKGFPKPQTIWTDENGVMLKNTIFKKNTPYDYSYHKTVEKLKKSQSYTCYAENKFGKMSVNVFVNVDSPFVVTKHLEDVTYVSFEKEEEIELICDIKSKWPMKISWWKDGKLVTSSISNDGTKLVVNKADIVDQDTYICQAELLEDGLTRAYKTKLQIKGQKPIVTVGQIKNTYEYNSKLYLDCNVKGYPKPQTIWTDENGVMLTNTIFKKNSPYDYSYLKTVENLKKSQNYTCYAENKFGKNSVNVFVNVDSPFVVTKHLEDVTYVFLEKEEEIELICDIKSKWPMKISWWKDGKLVTSSISNDGKKLVVNKANIVDQDTYICQAELLEDGLTRAYKTKLHIKGLKSEPIVTVGEIKNTYEYNSTLSLNCNVKGFPKPETIWTDENGTILKDTIIKKNTPYDYSYHKTIEKLKKSQNYTCCAENKFGKNSVIVFVNVDSPFVVTKHLEDVTYVSFEKEEEIELICDIKSKWPMKISWWKDGKLVTSSISNDGTKLVVNKADIVDQDTYICQAELLEDGLTRAYKTKLQIKGLKSEPIVTVGEIKNTYEYNSKLSLNCNVKGYPKPETIWTDENGTILRNTIIKKNTPYDYSYHKTIEKLKQSQSYTCYAENKFGKKSVNVFVNVDSPFVVTKHLEDVTYVSFEEEIELICDIKSKWTMNITWWNNGKLVASRVTNDGTKLVVNKANIKDQDTYICQAELLEDGLTRAYKTKLQIKGQKPIVTVGQIKNTYEYNSKLYLDCNVKGFPKPQTIWTDENGVMLTNTIFRKNTPYDYSYQKTIENLKKSQNFTCYAENKFGKNSVNVFVNVNTPFVVSKHFEDVTNVDYEKEIELICDIQSKWPMKITWWKNGKLITSHVSNDGTKLTIKKANIDDQGIYICEAKLSEDDPTLQYKTELKINGLIIPHIEKQTPFLIIKKAEPVTLTCKITKGFPAPERVWKFKEIGSDKWITITNSEEHLTIETSQLSSGDYKCLASNAIGHDEMDIKLEVEAPPEILPSEKTVYALELDLVLRITCHTVRYLKPTVTWRVNDSIIEVGEKYKLDKKNLVILNPVQNDSGNYTCVVQNKFGSNIQITEAIIKSNDILFINNPNIQETTTSNPTSDKNIEKEDKDTKYILEGSIISLDCPHAKDDAVRWYKDYRYLNITGSPLVIKNATTKDDGIYNCRVCNYYGTQTHSFKINVGYEPRGNTESVIINKDGSLDQTLSKSLACQFDVKPMTNEIEWTFNGERINENTTDFDAEIKLGIYTCSITNPHGTAKRTFTVISNDCLIKKSQITKNAPLILTEDSTWPDIYYNENYLRLSHNTNLKLFCRNQKENHTHFDKFSNDNKILATCVGENKFLVNGTIINFEDLQCNLPIQHFLNETGATCLNENTELVKVGYEADQFIEVYEVCVDKIAMVPLYTRIDMTPLYNVKSIQFETARVNETDADKCGEGSKCCFGKTQLVSENDVRFGPSQAATFIEINYVPYWRPCDEKLGWNDIEENITRKLEQIEGQFVIWSGASNYTKKSDVIIPRYLWKVIHFVDSKYSFSVVYVNDPTPAVEDKLCEDICNQFDWITSSESIYCCRVEEFRKAFNIP